MSTLLCLAIVLTAVIPAVWAKTMAWEAKLDNAMRWNVITMFGTLIIGSDAALAGYNPETGEKLWVRDDFKKLAPFDVREIEGFPILIIAQDKGIGGTKSVVEAIHMATGQTIWKTDTLAGAPLGVYPVAGKPLALFFINESSKFNAPGASSLGIALVAAVSAASALGHQMQYAAGQTSMSGASDNIMSQFKRMDRYLEKRFSKTAKTENYAFILTNVDDNGDKGVGVVAIDLKTGDVVRQVVFDEKQPEYNVDEIGRRVYFFPKKKGIRAIDLVATEK